MNDFISLKVSLNKSNPSIWRQIILHKTHTFFELHHIIQITMGWKNYHAYEFNLEGFRIGPIIEDEILEGYGNNSILDCNTAMLLDVVSNIGDIIIYEYDFGDGWQHTLEVKGFIDADHSLMYPICIAGEMACPPEDCGGIRGFGDLLEILKNKKHQDYKDYKRWLPRGYDPTKFNLEKVNKELGKLDRYISKWLRW